MYKVFSDDKCILIDGRRTKDDQKGVKVISFSSAEALHGEYKKFIRSSQWRNLIVIGEEEKIWTMFRFLFSFIEAAGGAVINKKGELLLIYRNGRWDLPKGKKEPGESSAQTAVREVEEECGVRNLKIVKPLISTYHVFSKNKKEYLKRTDWFEMLHSGSAQLIPQKEEGIQDAKWMNREEVKNILNLVYPSLREIINSTVFF